MKTPTKSRPGKKVTQQQDTPLLSVSYAQPNQKDKALAFAERHKLPCQPLARATGQLTLNFDEIRLEIIDLTNQMSLDVDFMGGSVGHRSRFGGGKGQTIARAAGIKQGKPLPWVLDATAGLARDSFVFASLGCRVTMLERSPIIAALVRDGIERASLNQDFSEITQQGFELIETDSLTYIENISEDNMPDVIYLDPMYPERKKSASVKKNMQILQKLVGQDTDTEQVLEAALHKARQRVVVKRPKGAPEIGCSRKPTLVYDSKSTRYDTYITH